MVEIQKVIVDRRGRNEDGFLSCPFAALPAVLGNKPFQIFIPLRRPVSEVVRFIDENDIDIPLRRYVKIRLAEFFLGKDNC